MGAKPKRSKGIVIVVATEFGEFMFDSDFKELTKDDVIEPVVMIRIQQEHLFPEDDLEEMRFNYTDEWIKESFHRALLFKAKKLFGNLLNSAENSWNECFEKKDDNGN